ncbi:agamous-like MADS-box protein AGL80 [Tripterygium wilfordii]|uniref:Agamous-like MADS-box protein AGL80 n=1 Tax=Tripterygium wilfordii TaxID=458696 RepID=A0A7J7BY85_TRIWF|nr:agamous-like MADS-box protein AGL80 [Tripterygium wilfordii]KAF5726859.1 agamous-like MADS-box protein AGL80 [Tripterygium wilfordii]
MTRKKVNLAYITNDSARKATFKKRKKGLIKKVSELSTLCGIDAAAIVYSPYDSQPEVWPSPGGVQHVISQFRRMPEMEQSKKMVNQESFIRQRIAKATEQLKKQRKDNREKEITHVMFQGLTGQSLNGLNILDLNDLNWLIEQNLKDINKAFESDHSPPVTAAPAPEPIAAPAPAVMASATTDFGENFVDQKPMTTLGHDQMNMQKLPWSMDMVNPQDQTGTGMGTGTWFSDEMMAPLPADNVPRNAFWAYNGFFP